MDKRAVWRERKRLEYLRRGDVLKARKRKERLKRPWTVPFALANSRCTNPNHPKYYRYGGRGIQMLLTMDEVNQLWFRDGADKMKRPSIDRKDNDGNYTFKNCRFIELSRNSKLRAVDRARDENGRFINVA